MHFIGEAFFLAIFIWFLSFSCLKFLNFAPPPLLIFIEFASYVLTFLFHWALCLNFLWVHLGVYLHLDFIKHSYNHSFQLYVLVGFYLIHSHWEPLLWNWCFCWRVCTCFMFHVSYITELTFTDLCLFCWLEFLISSAIISNISKFKWGLSCGRAEVSGSEVNTSVPVLKEWNVSYRGNHNYCLAPMPM